MLTKSMTLPLDADMELDESGNAVPKKNKKGWLSGLFNKAVDAAGRAAITNTLKIAAVTALAGAGASSFVTIGTAAAASAAGAALYVYGKETFLEWRRARAEERDMQWWDADRSRKVKIALLTGAAGGAFGAWFAGTETFKTGMEVAREFGGRALDFFVSSAHAAEPFGTLAAVAAPVAHMATGGLDIAHAAAPLQAALPVSLPDAAPLNPLGRLWHMAMTSNEAHGKFMAKLLPSNPDDMKSVSPQFLKDRAHEVLRLKDIPWQDRLNLAHDLAEEAKARGNKQAVQFLKDLAKLEHVKPQFNAEGAAHHAQATLKHVAKHLVTPKPEIALEAAPLEPLTIPKIDMPEIKLPEMTFDAMPADTVSVIPASPAILVESLPPPVPVAKVFSEAAVCTLSPDATTGANGVECVINKAVMQPGDYVSFVAGENPVLKAVTPLVEGSTDVPTGAFLHERIVADGVSKVDALRATVRTVATAKMK
ncbi:MAG: hypothetical protein PW788_07640 [Micavibrio sp.]|nr:hypothetical protein [Micavibrio sp.]